MRNKVLIKWNELPSNLASVHTQKFITATCKTFKDCVEDSFG